MANISIERELTLSGGRYIARIDSVVGEAELRFTCKSQALITADLAMAPDSMRGTGAAKALVDRLIADARSEGLRVIPLCSYVKAQYQRHPEWADVMQDEREGRGP